jgi:hypothetical protein
MLTMPEAESELLECSFEVTDEDRTGTGWRPDVNGRFWHLARAARDRGYPALIPIQPGKKACYLKGWPGLAKQPATDIEIREWIKEMPSIGFGYAHDSSLVAFDLDIRDYNAITDRMKWLAENIDGQPMIRIGEPPKCLVVYRADHTSYGHLGSPEVYCTAGQTVFFGIHPETHKPYRWQCGSPALRDWEELPVATGRDIWAFLRKFSGDPAIGYQRGTSAVKQFLHFATDNKVVIEDLKSFAAVIGLSHEGNRHHVLKSAIAYARHCEYDTQQINEILRPAYIDLFKGASMRTLRVRCRDFDDLVRWAEAKVPLGGQ